MRARLEKEARGRGGYRWNERDLFNAFQWFTATSTTMPSSSSSSLTSHPSNNNCSTSENCDSASFLEFLFRNPGITFHRTLIGHKRKRNSAIQHFATYNCAATSSSSDNAIEGPLLPFILGYCLSHCTLDTDESEEDKAGCVSSMQHVPSMEWLVSVLTDIATERRLTEVLYNNYSRILQNSAANTTTRTSDGDISHPSSSSSRHVTSVMDQMKQCFSQPSIIVQSAYASKLYTCYLRLLKNDDKHTCNKENMDTSHGAQERGRLNTERAVAFLQKIQALAEFHQDVAQVLFLMALEPIKRSRMYHDDLGWVRYAFSMTHDELLNHAIGSEPEPNMAFHPIAESIIHTIHNCEVYNISPCLICMLGKIHSLFAKELLNQLTRCYVKHQKQVPAFIAKEALQLSSVSDSKDTVDDPRLVVEKCRGVMQLWKNTSKKMRLLLTEVVENEKTTATEQTDSLALMALNEIERIAV